MKYRYIILIIAVVLIVLIIIGVIFARGMCYHIDPQPSIAVKNQLRVLFGGDKYGVNCMGESGQEVKFRAGARNEVICMIRTEEPLNYELKVKDIESLSGVSTLEVQKWIRNKDWKGNVSPGGNGTEANVLLLNIPGNTPKTLLRLTIEEINNKNNSIKKTHISYIDVVPSPSIWEIIMGC
jgi:hypothetical protein